MKKLTKKTKGASLVEYGIIVGLIAVVTVAAVLLTGRNVADTFETTNTQIESGIDASGLEQEEAVVGAITIDVGSLAPTGTVGGAYSQTLSASGVDDYVPGSITWTLNAGLLPDGLSLNGVTGVVSGTTTDAGVFTFTIEANDGNVTATQEFTITIS